MPPQPVIALVYFSLLKDVCMHDSEFIIMTFLCMHVVLFQYSLYYILRCACLISQWSQVHLDQYIVLYFLNIWFLKI